MAYATQSPAALAPQQGISRILGSVATRYARYSKYRRSISELSALTNRELSDLGLHRSMIKSVAYEEAYGASA
ncbi:hypothetical protein PSM7751_02465 [Pseudooceanicola marinus]|uniref:YjiS-like domain-containing protein n=1 Tax=Pseudooceanicola marinus TaxID=396013 RepID=A0A1X6ZFN4_9RHOB|nr:DUF1127 domain-containing protein [Pseudooceanicola marinus]PJE28497.1 DUF1127 domain-containing protein [Pseudooceanicola marinus]SLN50493.1 hypothetical protein PSM7751_02465 [Pseudooceanicola marinus]